MTVPSTPIIASYSYIGPGNYDFSFLAQLEADIAVDYIDTDGVITALTYGVDYTVVINAPSSPDGGTVTVSAPVSAGGNVRIYRSVPYTQDYEWENEGPIPLSKLEDSFDRTVMMLQQLDADVQGQIVSSEWKGAWAVDTSYTVNNLVLTTDNIWYVCISSHTSDSSAFSTDLLAGYWLQVMDIGYLETLTSQAAQSASEASASEAASLLSEGNASDSEGAAANSEANSAVSENNTANCAAEAYTDRVLAEAAKDTAEAAVAVGARTDAMNTDSYSATAGQTTFTITNPNAEDNILVFMNSRKLRLTEDYTLDSATLATTMTLNSGADLGDEIDIVNFNVFDNIKAAENVSIADAGSIITATDVEGALQENRTAIDLNTAKDTNVNTNIAVSYSSSIITIQPSDGLSDLIAAASNTNAGVLTATNKIKLDSIETGADVSSGLEELTEGGNTGWALIGRTAANYGDIGSNGVDLSISVSASTTRGATGGYGFCWGSNTTASNLNTTAGGTGSVASGNGSLSIGGNNSSVGSYAVSLGQNTSADGYASMATNYNTTAQNSYQLSIGIWNIGTSPTSLLEIGMGTGSSAKANVLEAHNNGNVVMPNLPTSDPTLAGALWNDSGTLKISAG